MVEVRLKTRCYPTEDRGKIVEAITDLFPDAEVSGTDELSGTSHSLDMFGELLKKQRIRDAARAVLRRGIRGNGTSFRLNKQVATVGKISFSEEDRPLGDIEVEIVADDLDAAIDGIAPHTRAGGGR
jgi:predicted RNA binding protein with dsRBD fold (UPF0201 family)